MRADMDRVLRINLDIKNDIADSDEALEGIKRGLADVEAGRSEEIRERLPEDAQISRLSR